MRPVESGRKCGGMGRCGACHSIQRYIVRSPKSIWNCQDHHELEHSPHRSLHADDAGGFHKQSMNGIASYEFFVRRLPENRGFLVAAGLEQALEYLMSARFTSAELDWLRSPEGFLRSSSITSQAGDSPATSMRCRKERCSSLTSRSCG